MRPNRQKGATLALIAAIAFVVVLVGVGIFSLMKLFGGARELQMLTDSGALNLGKSMVAVGIPLKTAPQTVQYQYQDSWMTGVNWTQPQVISVTLSNGLEGSAFAGVTDPNGNITLQNYNRVIAQTMLVGFNAQAEGTMAAAANAQQLFDTVQRKKDSISDRLLSKLSDPTIATPIFMNTGVGNSLRMLGLGSTPSFVTANYEVAYTNPGCSTNVWIDPSVLPSGITLPANALNAQTGGPNNLPYLNGYTDIDTGPITITGTPVFPGSQPHLIAKRDFDAGIKTPVQLGYVAPNSFSASCAAQAQVASSNVVNNAQSVVGTLNTSFPVSIPGGYVVLSTTTGVGGTFKQVISSLTAAQQADIEGRIVQRLREIKPDASVTQAQTFLEAQTFNANPKKPTYLYRYPDVTNPLYPAWHAQFLVPGAPPDGTPGQFFGSLVKPPTFPTPGTDPLFGMYPDGNTIVYAGWWEFAWTPAAGAHNFLGALTIP